jgi:hypothetical protein
VTYFAGFEKRVGKWILAAWVLAMGTTAVGEAVRAAFFVMPGPDGMVEASAAFGDRLGAHLANAGFEVVCGQEELARRTAGNEGEGSITLDHDLEMLTAQGDATARSPLEGACALRIARMLDADLLVVGSLVHVGLNRVRNERGRMPEDVEMTTLRMGLRVFEGVEGGQIYGDTVAVAEESAQNPPAAVDALARTLDRGAAELALRVLRCWNARAGEWVTFGVDPATLVIVSKPDIEVCLNQ